MDYQQHVDQLKELQDLFLAFLDNENDLETDYSNIISFLKSNKNLKDRLELYETLQLLLQIVQNHHRLPDFYFRIKKILTFLKEYIKKTFSNFEINKIFKKSKLILLILLEIDVITIDESNISNFNLYYFKPEIEKIIDKDELKEMIEKEIIQVDQNSLIDFNEKRRMGVNPSYVCELIRNDAIDDFIVYVNRNNISLKNTIIKHSIFETNEFLLDKTPTFIEYATFYGSIQIFQYLKLNNVYLNSSLWLYVIHSKNAELIHLLEENHVKPPYNYYENILEEAIKCHHNDIARYIQDTYLTEDNFAPICYRYYNYDLFPAKIEYIYLFKYDYVKLVDTTLKIYGNDINIFLKKLFYENHFSPFGIAIENDLEFVKYFTEKNIKIINKYEFVRMNSIKQIIIPSSVEIIGEHAFEGCISLLQLSIPSSVKEIGKSAFRKCINLVDLSFLASIEIIRKDTFRECASLTEITIPSSVKNIEDWALMGCSSLKKLTFQEPSSLISIGEFAFYSCIRLKKVAIPPSVVSIGNSAFEECMSLKEVIFESPSSLTSIGYFAFKGCNKISSSNIPSSVTSIGQYAFEKSNHFNFKNCGIC